jgi:hypothetical protein
MLVCLAVSGLDITDGTMMKSSNASLCPLQDVLL